VCGLSKVFGDPSKIEEALRLAEQGQDRQQILDSTGCTLAVQGVSFEVADGEIFVVMGLSGCGKSSVLRCLNRLSEPSAGEVRIDGEEIRHFSSAELLKLRRHKVSMVFQEFGLLPHRNVLENVEFPLRIRGQSREDCRAKAMEALDLVGLSGSQQSPVGSLSGGMRQRVGLARAIAAGTEILLMDEAFSALDPLIRTEMQDELLNMQSTLQKTIVFITHDLDEALKLGDRVAIMKDGRMVQIGTPEEILTEPADPYVEAFTSQVDRSRVLTAEALLRPPAVVIAPTEPLRSALSTANHYDLNGLFVVDDTQKLVGFVSTVELARAMLRHSDEQTCGGLAHAFPAPAKLDTPVHALLEEAAHTHHPTPVVDDNGRLLGLITRTALLAGMIGEIE
jgi:glycine betaine/proline transport system ATP-binding protein